VHLNANLTDIQKLYYLKNCLKGKTDQIINSLELTEENYNVALELIKEHYDNKCVIVQKHVRTIMNIPAIVKESVSDLRELIDSMNTHLRTLKSLDRPRFVGYTVNIYIYWKA
jgi:hypothetical protein